jgi:hypothetical protein
MYVLLRLEYAFIWAFVTVVCVVFCPVSKPVLGIDTSKCSAAIVKPLHINTYSANFQGASAFCHNESANVRHKEILKRYLQKISLKS